MNQHRDAALPAASLAAKRQSLAQWQQLMKRYPLTSPWTLVSPILTALGANAMTAHLLMSGRMTPFELVVLVALEAVLLTAIAWLQGLGMPPAAIERNPMPARERLATLAFGLFWLCGVYTIVFFAMVPAGDEILRAAHDPLAFLGRSTLKWPLLITAAGALVDWMQDAAHYRRHGGTFLSTPGFHGAARWLTLLLGGIPLFVPLVGLVFGIALVGRNIVAFWKKRFGTPRERVQAVLIVMIPVVGWLVLNGIGRLNAWLEPKVRGVGWWAVCYATAKFVAELFVICLPLIASKAHAEEAAALAHPSPAGGRIENQCCRPTMRIETDAAARVARPASRACSRTTLCQRPRLDDMAIEPHHARGIDLADERRFFARLCTAILAMAVTGFSWRGPGPRDGWSAARVYRPYSSAEAAAFGVAQAVARARAFLRGQPQTLPLD